VVSYNPASRITTLKSTTRTASSCVGTQRPGERRGADVFGILVGTLGVADYLPLIKRLRSLLAKDQNKTYTISVGKVNPSKLANFLEIDRLVLVACPEDSIIDAKGFLGPNHYAL
jgi:diphthamide biosynthesis protein 2